MNQNMPASATKFTIFKTILYNFNPELKFPLHISSRTAPQTLDDLEQALTLNGGEELFHLYQHHNTNSNP